MIIESKMCQFCLQMWKSQIWIIVSLFFREADKVLTGDDVLVYVNEELFSEKVTNVTDFNAQGKSFTTYLQYNALLSS